MQPEKSVHYFYSIMFNLERTRDELSQTQTFKFWEAPPLGAARWFVYELVKMAQGSALVSKKMML